MSQKGHEERFPVPKLSGRNAFGWRTIAGASGNEKDAPFPAIRETASFDGFKQALWAYAGPVVSLFQIRGEVG